MFAISCPSKFDRVSFKGFINQNYSEDFGCLQSVGLPNLTGFHSRVHRQELQYSNDIGCLQSVALPNLTGFHSRVS